MKSSLFSGQLGRLYSDMAQSDKILERPHEYSDTVEPKPVVIPAVKIVKTTYERIKQDVSYNQQLKDQSTRDKLASGEVIRCKKWSSGSNWGQPKRMPRQGLNLCK